MNKAQNDVCYSNYDAYLNNGGSDYSAKFTIPAPAVAVTARPYAGIESIITAAPESGTTIDGQTFQYQFERSTNGGSSWTTVQPYSSTATYTYTPASTNDIIRVKMKVVETSEESAYVTQTVYEQYYIYVEDTQNWGQMWMTMKNTDNDTYYLGRVFPGEKLMPCDTIDDKPIYRVTLDSYFHRLWLSVGSSSKQTYDAGFPINYDQGTTYGIKKEHTGHYFKILPGIGGANDCYLKDYSTAIYRVVSYDGATGKTYYSNAISPTEGTGTVSFFANPADAGSYVKIQTWSEGADTGGSANLDGTWNTGSTDYKSNCSSVSATGNVFTATLSNSVLSNIAKYNGEYDIHVYANTKNNLEGGVAKGGVGTKFTYFEPNVTIFPGELFNHYWVDWFAAADISVVATVGNTYNSDLAGVISTDPYAPYGQTTGDGANVRYGYNPTTNYFSRTMIAGNGDEIKIIGARVNPNAAGYNAQSSFSDASAWVYTVAAVVKGKATATVTTSYNSYAQTLTANQQLIGGDANDNTTTYNVLITYDYKTNRLLAAWEPGGSIAGFSLESNLMVVRTENGTPTVLNITTENTDLTNITKIYTALELSRSNWIQSGGNADRRIVSGSYVDEYYWISLPYECKISDIFGIDGYGSSWVIQTYHGDYRAEQGWWAETDSWWYDMDRDGVMQANQGYVVRFTNLNGENSLPSLPRRFASEEGAKLYLYFPSSANNLSIGRLGDSKSYTLDPMHCDKWNRNNSEANNGENNPTWDRRAIDSNWRIIGSPSFNTTTITSPDFSSGSYPSAPDGYRLKYCYKWAANTNPRYTITTTTALNSSGWPATHAYLVQYEGGVTFAKKDDSNPLVGMKAPARHSEDTAGEQTLRLVLYRNGEQADVTFISRMEEGATEGYDLNLDLSKLLSSSGNNLYTLAGYYKMAGNCLPDTVQRIPVGIQLASEGDYTFAMPDGTGGIGVFLIDRQTNTRTNLALTDYTVTLSPGTHDARFALELSPLAQTPTGIGQLPADGMSATNARKTVVDGVLYIIRDGQIFDARGARIQ